MMRLPTHEAVETNSMTRLNKMYGLAPCHTYINLAHDSFHVITMYSRLLISRIKCNYIINIVSFIVAWHDQFNNPR